MTQSALRTVAIRLACSHHEDREWILARLDPAQRQQLEALLEEINLLGLASDPAVVKAVLAERSPGRPVAPEPDRALVELAAKAGHPAWQALALQLLDREVRPSAVKRLAQPERVQRWDSVFAQRSMPTQLVAALQAYLVQQESPHGRI